MTRKECRGVQHDESDRCDFYDTEGWCHKYGDMWGEGTGGTDVECITYCEHRTVKKNQINDASNPLIMERIPRWNEVEFNGVIKMIEHEFYNPSGVRKWADGRMYDPESNLTIMPDGTIVDGERDPATDRLYEMLDKNYHKLRKRIDSVDG